MFFKDIIGQAAIKKQLTTAVREHRLGHAIMIIGQDGYGGLSIARALASYLFCTNPGMEDACGTCNACNKMVKFNHPDITYSFPFIAKDANTTASLYLKNWREVLQKKQYLTIDDWREAHSSETKSVNINAAECNEITKQLHFKALEAQERILILWKPQYLDGIGNKLLKILEEPPQGSRIIMVTDNPDRLLGTIQSRTQSYILDAIEPDLIAQYLIEKEKINPEQAYNLAHTADGDVIKALQNLHKNDDQTRERFSQFINLIQRNDIIGLQPWIEETAGHTRDQQRMMLKFSLDVLEWNLMNKYRGENNSVAGLVQAIPINSLKQEQVELLNRTMNRAMQYISRNVNSKLLWTNLVITWKRVLLSK